MIARGTDDLAAARLAYQRAVDCNDPQFSPAAAERLAELPGER
jgi:hypothetical protein